MEFVDFVSTAWFVIGLICFGAGGILIAYSRLKVDVTGDVGNVGGNGGFEYHGHVGGLLLLAGIGFWFYGLVWG